MVQRIENYMASFQFEINDNKKNHNYKLQTSLINFC
jgi:hypothetical protein